MKIAILSLLLVPMLASAQAPQPYQSPATVAKQAKARCAAMAPQQRPDCESKSRAEVRASIDRHHQMKRAAASKPAAKARPKAAPRTPQK